MLMLLLLPLLLLLLLLLLAMMLLLLLLEVTEVSGEGVGRVRSMAAGVSGFRPLVEGSLLAVVSDRGDALGVLVSTWAGARAARGWRGG